MTLVFLKPLVGILGQSLLRQEIESRKKFPRISFGLFLTLSLMTTQPVVVLLVAMAV